MAITLTDDGTLDTVLRCDQCGEEMRYNYDGEPPGQYVTVAAYLRGVIAFVNWAIDDAEQEHECQAVHGGAFADDDETEGQ